MSSAVYIKYFHYKSGPIFVTDPVCCPNDQVQSCDMFVACSDLSCGRKIGYKTYSRESGRKESQSAFLLRSQWSW